MDIIERFRQEVVYPSNELHDINDCGDWYKVEAGLMDRWLKNLKKEDTYHLNANVDVDYGEKWEKEEE